MQFNMAAIHHLGFVGGSHGTTHKGPFTVANPRKKICNDQCSSVSYMFEFLSFMLESPIHGAKISVFEV